MKVLFIRGPLYSVRLLGLIALSIALMVMDHREHGLHLLRRVLSDAVAPLQYTIDLPTRTYSWLRKEITTHQTLIAADKALMQENLILRGQLLKFQSLENENAKLRELLHSSPRAGERVEIAELLSVSADPFVRQIVLNKGKRNNAYPGQPVLDAEGVVGQVIEVDAHTSRVLLITDARSAVPVEVERNGYRSVLQGKGLEDELLLSHVSDTSDIQVGDLLVTSGLGGHYPRGYPVGSVAEIKHNDGQAFATVKVSPAAQFNKEHDVLLSWPKVSKKGKG